MPAVITGLEVGGQLTTTSDVENWPGGEVTLQGPDLMERFREHAERFAAASTVFPEPGDAYPVPVF